MSQTYHSNKEHKLTHRCENCEKELSEFKAKYFRLQTWFRYFAFSSILTITLLILWKM